MVNEDIVNFKDADGSIREALQKCLDDYRKKHPNDHPLNRSFILRQIIMLGIPLWKKQACI